MQANTLAAKKERSLLKTKTFLFLKMLCSWALLQLAKVLGFLVKEFFLLSCNINTTREVLFMTKLLTFAVASATMAFQQAALSSPVEAVHFGTWAPSSAVCRGEPRIDLSASAIRIHFRGQVHTYGNLLEDPLCFAGASGTDTRHCVMTAFKAGYAFALVFNINGDPNVMEFEQYGRQVAPYQLPPFDQIYHRCAP